MKVIDPTLAFGGAFESHRAFETVFSLSDDAELAPVRTMADSEVKGLEDLVAKILQHFDKPRLIGKATDDYAAAGWRSDLSDAVKRFGKRVRIEGNAWLPLTRCFWTGSNPLDRCLAANLIKEMSNVRICWGLGRKAVIRFNPDLLFYPVLEWKDSVSLGVRTHKARYGPGWDLSVEEFSTGEFSGKVRQVRIDVSVTQSGDDHARGALGSTMVVQVHGKQKPDEIGVAFQSVAHAQFYLERILFREYLRKPLEHYYRRPL